MDTMPEPRPTGPEAGDVWALVHAAAAGDPQALDRFCRRFGNDLRHWLRLRWRGSPWRHQVDDAAQEVLLECFRPGGALARVDARRCRHFESYLRGVMSNVAARIARREARATTRWHPSGLLLRAGGAPDAEPRTRLDLANVRATIDAAVGRLELEGATAGHTLAELVRLHFFDGLPVRAIAARWHEPAARIHEQRRRARILLRRSLAGVADLPASAAGLPRRLAASA
jgi:RNA polymerase sigma factor (sigma-70 family)